MEMHHLFKIQEIMEKNMQQISQIEEDQLGRDNIFELRFLALQVKIGEIANLTKCYKYTRIKEDLSREKLIVRYIDAMKFLLSIGNVHELNIINRDIIDKSSGEKSIIKVFSGLFDDIIELKHALQRENYADSLSLYIQLFTKFINLGKVLGLTFDEVYNYYSDFAKSYGIA